MGNIKMMNGQQSAAWRTSLNYLKVTKIADNGWAINADYLDLLLLVNET